MKIEEESFITQKTARVYRLKPEGEIRGVVFAIHGYRQLGFYFIKKFEALAKMGLEVIVPEGLHRFYIEGYSCRVGASWMTKEARESDINDYLFYLNHLLEKVKEERPEAPFHLIGFSQGGATASRWFNSHSFKWGSFLLYASVFPNDFDFEHQSERLTEMPCVLAFGDEDQFASEEVILEKMEWLQSKGVRFALHRFKGGHEIYDSVLENLAKTLGW